MRGIYTHALCAALVVASVVAALGAPEGRAGAAPAGDATFAATWARTDAPVADGVAQRTWLWGPAAYSGAIREPYADAPDGTRLVQYYDKSRMELADPNGDPASPWRVTNGLLVVELATGRVQLGDDQFEQRLPAEINVAGDPDDPTGPTYATFGQLRDAPPAPDGAPLTQRLARDGSLTDDPTLAAQGATAAQRVSVPGLDHQVASPFWAFMNARGMVQVGDQLADAPLFENPYYATGYPITEAYWATVRVGGAARDVLTQCFERRCLTWTPANPEGWKVEAGNVGQHYYRWRYDDPAARQQFAARAAAANAAMLHCFYRPDAQLFAETCPDSGPNPYAYNWPFAQAFAAGAALAGATGDTGELPARLAGAERYWDPAASPPGYYSYVGSGDKFYDDNAWLGLALVQTYRLTGDATALARANQVFDFIVAGWDADPAHPAPGGVFWTQAGWSRDRNTVSNAPSAELGLLLAEQTADPVIRDQRIALARMLLDWVDANLRDSDGLYWDHIGLDGSVDTTKWTYNQGAMLGAYALLYRVTGDADALTRATAIADAALAHYDAGALDAQPAPFNAVFFRNLLLLASQTRNPAYPEALRAYAERLWNDHRDPSTDLATLSAPLALLDQAALVEVNALLAWDPDRWGLLT